MKNVHRQDAKAQSLIARENLGRPVFAPSFASSRLRD